MLQSCVSLCQFLATKKLRSSHLRLPAPSFDSSAAYHKGQGCAGGFLVKPLPLLFDRRCRRPGMGPGLPVFRPTRAERVGIPPGEYWRSRDTTPKPVVVVRIGRRVPVAVRAARVVLIVVPRAPTQHIWSHPHNQNRCRFALPVSQFTTL